MLVVRVELWPYGLEEAKELLAEATIANRGRDEIGYRYAAELREREDLDFKIAGRSQTVEISGYDRQQSVWALVHTMLLAARSQDNP